jgi:hypothetical protein
MNDKQERAASVVSDEENGRIRFDRVTSAYRPANPRDAGWPVCAKCGKPVDDVVSWDDPTRGSLGWLCIAARCHGEVDVIALDVHDAMMMLDAGRTTISLAGVAFSNEPKKLTVVATGAFTGGDSCAIGVSSDEPSESTAPAPQGKADSAPVHAANAGAGAGAVVSGGFVRKGDV